MLDWGGAVVLMLEARGLICSREWEALIDKFGCLEGLRLLGSQHLHQRLEAKHRSWHAG